MTAIRYSTVAITIIVIGQVAAAFVLPEVVEEHEAGTDMPSTTPPTAYLPTTQDTSVTDESGLSLYQEALKWLRLYKYLPQEGDHACESCPLEECQIDCLDILKEVARDALIEFQKFYQFEPTGLLTPDEIAKMRKPRCGDSDKSPDDVKNGGRSKRWARLGSSVWPAEEMPLQISVNGGSGNIDERTVEDVALECARLWAEPSSLSFQLAAHGIKGNIDITFVRIDGPYNTIGQGLSPIIWGDKSSYLKLDSSETWKRDKRAAGYGVSLKWAICHEMGHNLGLSHSNDKKAIMYPSSYGQDEEKLPRDDERGITTLYPGRNGKTVYGRARRPGPPTRPPTTRRPTTRRPPTRRPTTRRPPTRRPTTRRPLTRRPTTRRPPTRRPTTRASTRPRTRPTTHAPPTPSRHTTPYRRYNPNRPNYAPPGHQPRYRPSTRAPTRPREPTTRQQTYWELDPVRNIWVLREL